MMLVRGYPLRDAGPPAPRRSRCARPPSRSPACPANPHYLFWALFELGWAHYFSGNLDAPIEACEESARVGAGRLNGGTMPSAGGGPGWALAVARLEIGEVERALRDHARGRRRGARPAIPVERCFNWEILALAELALGPGRGRRERCAAPRSSPRSSASPARALAARTRAAVLLAAATPRRPRVRRASPSRRGSTVGARLPGRVLAQPARAARSPPPASAPAAIAELREAERELDVCGSVRVRDECRRELRKLGARAETRGPATAERLRRRRR